MSRRSATGPPAAPPGCRSSDPIGRRRICAGRYVVFPLAGRDMEIDDAAKGVGEIRELVVVRGEERLRPRSRIRCNITRHRPRDAQAVEVAVPRSISSRTTRLFDVAPLRICAVSCISTMNVDCPRAMLSDAPTRA